MQMLARMALVPILATIATLAVPGTAPPACAGTPAGAAFTLAASATAPPERALSSPADSGARPTSSPDAASGTAQSLTPESAVALALEHHPMLRAAGEEVAGATADLSIATSGYLPRLDLTEDWVRSTNPVFVFASKLGQQSFGMSDFALDALNTPDAYTNAATRLSLRQNVWDAGRTLKGRDAAKLGIAAARDSLVRSRESVAFGARRAFWDAVLADEMVRVVRAAEEAARSNAALASQQVDAGLAVPSDRMSADVRLAEVRAMRIRAEQGAAVARAALRQALGLSDDRPFELVPPSVTASTAPAGAGSAATVPGGGSTVAAGPGGAAFGDASAAEGGPDGAESAESRAQEALVSRTDLKSLDQRIAQAGVGEKIARSRYYPEIGVGAQYEWNSQNLFGNEGNNWTVGASLRLPVFDGTETRARLARARSDSMRLSAMREAMAEGIRLEVRAAWADRAAAAERLSVAEEATAQADEALRIVRERYGEGMAVMVELLGAEAARTQAQGARAVAVHDLAVAQAALDLASGRTTVPPQEISQETNR